MYIYTPIKEASSSEYPRDNNPVIIPDKISPDPAVANNEFELLIRKIFLSLETIMVVGPFKIKTRPSNSFAISEHISNSLLTDR